MKTLVAFLTRSVAVFVFGGMIGLGLVFIQASLAAMPLWVQVGGTGLWGLAIAGALHPRLREGRVWLLPHLGILFALHVLAIVSLPVVATMLGTWTPGTPLTTAALLGPPTGDPAFDQLSAHLGIWIGWMVTSAPLLFGACAVGMVLYTWLMDAYPRSPTPPEEDAPC